LIPVEETKQARQDAGSGLERGSAVFELDDVYHRYGWNEVVFGVSLTVHSGEVVALVGDNGSGKSTLLKIMSGYQRPTKGRLRLLGKDVTFRSPAQARDAGIEAVYQDLAIIDDLSLWRNFFLGKERRRGFGGLGVLDVRGMRAECETQLRALGLVSIRSGDQHAWVLSGGERQSVAIARAMYFGAKLLLLDEPTAALSVRETSLVLQGIDDAREKGLGVLYIDHNIGHVLPVADRILLLEHGRIARTIMRGDITEDELKEMIAKTPLRRK
jgi:simple sugar transport system ATP-binding protein